MSGLFGNLANGVKALTAQSRSIETAGRNLANVNNPDYARQRVVYGDRGTVRTTLGAQSLGIEAKSIQQLRDTLLDRQVVREVGIKSSYLAQQSAYQKAQAGLGQSVDRAGETGASGSAGTGSGIAETLTDFFNAFQSFSARPTDNGERQTLLQKAGILTSRINSTDARLAQAQTDLTDQITQDVTGANRILSTLADLNSQIGRFEIGAPGIAVDLRDQRQAQLEELSKIISIESRVNATNPSQLDVFVRDASNNPIQLLNLAAVTGPITFSASTISAGSPSTAVALTGGSIHGSLIARDTGIASLRTDLNNLSLQLVNSVNTAYNPTTATGNFFNPAGTTAATITLATGLTTTNLKASDGGAAGDNTIAQAVANLANTTWSTGAGAAINGTFIQHYSRAVSDLGQNLATANARVDSQNNIEELIRNQRDAVSGVSLDEEMSDLLKYQRSFQASARVINIIDDLLDTVVNRLGRT